mmetsp:Transcript_18097/g.49665  ORF Transcript_18097/g.49665 Transcript_18097/m.49665 type:complete len:208 (+) Transcript_18097:1489-2112(+)
MRGVRMRPLLLVARLTPSAMLPVWARSPAPPRAMELPPPPAVEAPQCERPWKRKLLQSDEGSDAQQQGLSPAAEDSARGQHGRPTMGVHKADICSCAWTLSRACAMMPPTSSSCIGSHTFCMPRSMCANLSSKFKHFSSFFSTSGTILGKFNRSLAPCKLASTEPSTIELWRAKPRGGPVPSALERPSADRARRRAERRAWKESCRV